LSQTAFCPVAGLAEAHRPEQSRDDHLRVVAIDKGDPDSRYVALAAGADAVISPPLRGDEVMRAIRVAEGPGGG
jgi:hypothetical protein